MLTLLYRTWLKVQKTSTVLIDNYIDDSTLTLFSKKIQVLSLLFIPKVFPSNCISILKKYNKQYNNLATKTTKKLSWIDFLIIDDEVYHFGASLKDLGHKIFCS